MATLDDFILAAQPTPGQLPLFGGPQQLPLFSSSWVPAAAPVSIAAPRVAAPQIIGQLPLPFAGAQAPLVGYPKQSYGPALMSAANSAVAAKSLKDILSGMKGNVFSKASIGKGLAGAIGAGIGQSVADERGGARDYAGNIISGASIGGSIGSMILPGWGTAIGAGLGGIAGGLKELWDKDTRTASEDAAVQSLLAASANAPRTQTAVDLLNQFYAQNPYQAIEGIDYVSPVEKLNRDQRASLNNWLAETGRRGERLAQGQQDVMNQIGARAELLGGRTEADLAAAGSQLGNVYDTLAANQAAAMAAEQNAGGSVAGLAGLSGGDVTAANTGRTANRSLVDYLGREGANRRGDLQAISESAQLQGSAYAGQTRRAIELAALQARERERAAAAERLSAAQMAQQQQDFAIRNAQAAWNNARQDKLIAATIEDAANAQVRDQAARQTAAQARLLYRDYLPDAERKALERAGISEDEFALLMAGNPENLLIYSKYMPGAGQ